MQENKLKTITNLFEGKEIRSMWNSEIEDYYFSVVDVIGVLTDSSNPKRYWTDLKIKLTMEGSQLYENIVQLKLKAKDGKYRSTDVLDTEGIFRLIESVPSRNAEPFKLWLAKLGRQEVDNVFDPSKGIDKMIDYYMKKGYNLEWIEARIKAIINRKKLTNTWKEQGIEENKEYAILTNEIYKSWEGMNAKELTRKYKPQGLDKNKNIAKVGGEVAKVARNDLEEKLGESIISNKNTLVYQYTKELENSEESL